MLRDALLCGTTKIPMLIAQVSSAMAAACMVALIGLNTMTIADIVKLNLGAAKNSSNPDKVYFQDVYCLSLAKR